MCMGLTEGSEGLSRSSILWTKRMFQGVSCRSLPPSISIGEGLSLLPSWLPMKVIHLTQVV